jgi:hypothetical protein
LKNILSIPNGSEATEIIKNYDENQCVELTVDSKGKVKPTVKVYDEDIQVASKKAQEVMDNLLKKYGSED